MSAALCRHCLLPVRRGGYTRAIDGEPSRFCCYGCALAFLVRHGQGEEAEAVRLLIRLGAGGFLAMNIMLLSLLLYSGTLAPEDAVVARAVHWALFGLTTVMMAFLGGPFMRQAWCALREGRLTADTLISLGTLSAYGYSAYQVLAGGDAVYFDTVTMVLVLFTLGRYLEAAVRARAMRNLAPLLAAERAEATVVEAGGDRCRSVNEARARRARARAPGRARAGRRDRDRRCVGMRRVGPHRRTPGPEKTAGAPVYAGSLNGRGQLLVRLTAAGRATRWGEISAYVRRALARPGGLERFVDRVAGAFVPAVILLAIGVVAFWSQSLGFAQALMIGLAVLVVACPCALGLAAPLATTQGLARALERGVLVRGAEVLEGSRACAPSPSTRPARSRTASRG